eukprot:gene6385-6617_t
MLTSSNAGSNGSIEPGNGLEGSTFAVHGASKAGSGNNSWDQQQQQKMLVQLPSEWARKLEAIVEVLQMAGEEEGRAAAELQGNRQRMQLLESNVGELHKLVDTQGDLQAHLTSQLSAAQADTRSHEQQAAALQQQLTDSQSAVAALADELQECQSKLSGSETDKAALSQQLSDAQQAVADRDQALDVLADELVEAAAAQEDLINGRQQAEEQVLQIVQEFEEGMLQLANHEQTLQQVLAQLRGIPGLRLRRDLRDREQALKQLQVDYADVTDLLQQVQDEQQHPAVMEPAASSARLREVEGRLHDTTKKLAAVQVALSDANNSLATEKAARLAAEDGLAGQQQLQQQLCDLQAELAAVHGQLLAERKVQAKMQDDLALMTTSRDTWRDAARKAEASIAEARANTEAKATELTRARAELLRMQQQLDDTCRQLEGLQQLAAPGRAGSPAGADRLDSGRAGLDELTTKLVAEQVGVAAEQAQQSA